MSSGLNVLVPSIPARHRLTQGMWEDFLCDPVLAAWVLMGYKLDAFQAVRLREYWWSHQCIDSSGTSSGKTLTVWIAFNLRCILLPERTCGIYYQTFQAGKSSFWEYYRKCKSPMFHSQFGRTDEMGDVEVGANRTRGAACWTAYFKNGSKLDMPAPSAQRDADTQASTRYHDLLLEEWTRIEDMGNAIDGQLKGRASEPTWNQHHPIWGNHILYSAHARTRMHKSFRRYSAHAKEIARGNPLYSNLHFSHKDYSNLPSFTGKSFREQNRAGSTIESEKLTTEKAEWLGKGLGIWGISGVGWFTEEALMGCVASGTARGVLPLLGRNT